MSTAGFIGLNSAALLGSSLPDQLFTCSMRALQLCLTPAVSQPRWPLFFPCLSACAIKPTGNTELIQVRIWKGICFTPRRVAGIPPPN